MNFHNLGITVEDIAKQIAFKKQEYTQRAGVRPFGLSCIIAGFDEGGSEPKLFLTDPSGQVTRWKAGAIGKNSDKVLGILEEKYKEDMPEDEQNMTTICELNHIYNKPDGELAFIDWVRKHPDTFDELWSEAESVLF